MIVEKNLKFKTLLFFILLTLIALSSCKMRAEQKSLTSRFDIIDVFIADNQFEDALSELEKVEKQVYDSWSFIGIYKRYEILGEKLKAEKILKKAIKKNSKNQELLAVYSNFLIQNNRIDEAVELSEPLKGGKYGSFHSEAVLRQLKNLQNPLQPQINSRKNKKNQIVVDQNYYKKTDLYDIYIDAYKGSLNPVWIRNCALFHLRNGYFETAASLQPSSYADCDDAYFWGMALYDAGKYYNAITALETAQKYIKDFPDTKNRRLLKTSEIQIVALESDTYMAVSEMENADLIRQQIIGKLDELDKVSNVDEELLPKIVVNSAIYALDNKDEDSSADLLFYSVNRWPDYVPSLVLYSDFAYNSNKQRDEDFEIQALRKAGLASVSMEKYDNRRKIPLNDALFRIDDSLSRQNNPYLSIAKLDLKYKMNSNFTVQEKTVDLWNLLEDNYTEQVKYESLLTQYALSFLLKTKQYEEAYSLFTKHVYSAYDFDKNQSFWHQFEKKLPGIDLRIAEFGAWFAAYYKKLDEALRIYEYCVYESGGVLFEGVVSPYVSTVSCMNLGDIYYSIGQWERALDLYGRAAGRESNAYLRSEIFYRIACIYVTSGDKKNALRSADYACAIYPNNERAALLKTRMGK